MVTVLVVLALVLFIVTVAFAKPKDESSEHRSERLRAREHGGIRAEEFPETINGLPVRIEHVLRGRYKDKRFVRIVSDIRAPRFWKAGAAEGGLSSSLTSDDWQVGDPKFDKAVYIRNGDQQLRATLNAPMRKAVMEAVQMGGWLDEGAWHLEVPERALGAGGATAVAQELVRLVKPFADRLGRSEDEGLYEVVTTDPVPAVRDLAAQLILAEGKDSKPAHKVMEHIRTDPWWRRERPRFVLDLAKKQGAAAVPTFLELVGQAGIPDEVRLEALEALQEAEPQQAAGRLTELLPQVKGTLLVHVLHSLDRMGRTPAADVLFPLLDEEQSAEVRMAACELLASQPHSQQLEQALIECLNGGGPELTMAAAHVLATVGTRDAVEPMRRTAEALTVLIEVRRALEDAIENVQSRLNAEVGRLAVVEVSTEEGGLSVATQGEGGLSETEDHTVPAEAEADSEVASSRQR